jgi:inositol phosphorylceramide mannosyltransferase catalytic subunit
MRIPKLIHQTTPNKDWALSHPALGANIARLQALNPGWEYRLYDDAYARAFITAHYGAAMLARFERINPVYGAARADLFRYLLLYELGGVYLDIKSTIDRPLDELLKPDDEYILSHWRNGKNEPYEDWGVHPSCGPRGEFQQWHIIAAPKHPFLRAVIRRVAANIDRYLPGGWTGKQGVLFLTGPIPYTLGIMPFLAACGHRVVDSAALGFNYCVVPHLADRMAPGQVHYTQCTEPVVLPG